MRYTIRNVQPSVLFIPDADLRLDAGQTAVVATLTPQMASLLAISVLEVVANDVPASVPVVTPPSLDELSQDTPAMAMPIPAGPSSLKAPAEAVTVPPAAEAKRSGRKTAEPPVILESRDDAQ